MIHFFYTLCRLKYKVKEQKQGYNFVAERGGNIHINAAMAPGKSIQKALISIHNFSVSFKRKFAPKVLSENTTPKNHDSGNSISQNRKGNMLISEEDRLSLI